MRLAFSTLGCPDWPIERIIERAGALGFAAVELRGVGDALRSDRIDCFSPARLPGTLRLARDAGVSFCCVGASARFDDAAMLDEMLADGRAALELARRIGAPHVRVFGDRIGADGETRSVARVADGVRALVGFAEGTGVGVLLESHGDFNTAERLLDVARRVDSSIFGLIWDVAHVDRAYGDNFGAFFERARPYIRHVHIKDHRRADGFALCGVGQGDIPIPSITRALEASGYGGFYSFEWEKRWHPDLDDPERSFHEYLRYMRMNCV